MLRVGLTGEVSEKFKGLFIYLFFLFNYLFIAPENNRNRKYLTQTSGITGQPAGLWHNVRSTNSRCGR